MPRKSKSSITVSKWRESQKCKSKENISVSSVKEDEISNNILLPTSADGQNLNTLGENTHHVVTETGEDKNNNRVKIHQSYMKNYMKNYRENNKEFRDKEKEKDRLLKRKQRMDSSVRAKKNKDDQAAAALRRMKLDVRELKRESDRTYAKGKRQEPEVRALKRESDRTYAQVKRQEQEVRELKRESDRTYANIKRQEPEVRQLKRESDRTYAKGKRQEPEVRELKRKSDRTYTNVKRQEPEVREMKRKSDRLYAEIKRKELEVREKKRESDRLYANVKRDIPEVRNVKRNQDRISKAALRNKPERREKERQRDKEAKKRLRLEELLAYRELLLRKTSLEAESGSRHAKLFHDFLLLKKNGPDIICCCCENLFFRHSVQELDLTKIKQSLGDNNLFDTLLGDVVNNSSNYICKTCLNYFKKGQVPKMATSQGLKFPTIPPCLKDLNPLEERMCAPYIPFMQIRPLLPHAVNPQLSLKGSVVNIPVEINNITKILPRNFNDMSTIQIKLKRHIDHVSDYMHETIRPAKICEALKYLVNTPLYKKYGITIDPKFFSAYEKCEELQLNFIVDDRDDVESVRSLAEQDYPSSDDESVICQADDEVLIVDHNQETSVRGSLVIAPGQGRTPVSWHNTPFIDELCFPKIYGGFPIDELRILSYSKRIKSECRRNDRRSCIPTRILFMAKQKLERSVLSNINVCLRKIKPNSKKISVSAVKSDEFLSDVVHVDDGFRCLNQVRSSPAFWESKKKHLLAMIRQNGFPTFFMTLSATEIKWPELLRILYSLAEGKQISLEEAMYMDLQHKTHLIRQDPVTCVRYIENIFIEIMKFLEHSYGPFGENFVQDYFQRREFQVRGSVHTHNLLYCKDAPKYDSSRPESEEECIQFIDKHITCRYDPTNPNMAFQRHKHTYTCYKGRKNKRSCRFNYPIPVMPRTMILQPLLDSQKNEFVKNNWLKIKDKMSEFFDSNINIPFEDILHELNLTEADYILAVRSSIVRAKVFLKRCSLEVAINSYNLSVLNLLSSNMDLQFVLDPYSCASYMLNYVTKVDAGLSKLLRQAAEDIENGNTSIRDKLRKIGNVFINSNVMGAQEAVYHILGLPLTLCSRACIFINTSPIEERTRMLKSKSALDKLNIDSEDILVPNIFDKYSQRPKNLENICLADFAALINLPNKPPNENDDDPVIKQRKKPKLLKYRRYKHAQDPDQFYREQLLMFTSWRDELLEIQNVDWEKKYLANILIIENNRNKYSIIGDEIIDAALEEAFNQDIALEEEEDIMKEGIEEGLDVNLFPEKQKGKAEDDNEKRNKIRFSVPLKIDIKDTFQALNKLNKEQKQIVMHVLHAFKTDSLPLRIYISGSAGVGKSTVINSIFQLISNYFEEKVGPKSDSIKVLLTAPSGKAAFNVSGMTLHSAFSLPVTQFGGKMPELSADIANTIRSKLFDLKLLIIDEISMVGQRLLQRVDTRLRQIMGRDESFGGVSVILVGDLNQLPPVHDTPLYKPPQNNDLTIFAGNFLWEEFRCFELIQIMRQKDDQNFVIALNNLAAGKMDEADISLIKSREVAEKDVPNEAIRLMATKDAVEKYNETKINNFPGDSVLSVAIDHITGQSSKAIRETLNKKNTAETGGLPRTINFKLGIKYMVTSNVDISDGLVNGACGKLVDIAYKDGNIVDKVWIDFGLETIGLKARKLFSPPNSSLSLTATPISRTTVPINLSKNMTCQIIREQFPLVPAEAITIHKSQGQTYSLACIDLSGKSKMNRHRAILYVALSRVTSINNLYILGRFIPPTPPKPGDKPSLLHNEIVRLREEKKLSLSFEYNLQDPMTFVLIYQNVRSFVKHTEHILNDPWYLEGDILIFSETWTLPSDSLSFPGYNVLFRSDGNFTSRSARGIVCFFKNNIDNIKLIHSVQYNEGRHHLDLIILKLHSLHIITGYRSPSTPNSYFFKYFEDCIKLIPNYSRVIVIGDFNYDSYREDADFPNILRERYGLERALAPRIPTTNFSTQIDVIFANKLESLKSGTYESYFSDHKPIYVVVPRHEGEVLTQLASSSPDQVVDLISLCPTPPGSLSPVLPPASSHHSFHSNHIINDEQSLPSLINNFPYFPKGMINNNSENNCYCNSVLQFLLSIQDFRFLLQFPDPESTVGQKLFNIFTSPQINLITSDLRPIVAEASGLPEFSTNDQQDAAEFLYALISSLSEFSPGFLSLFSIKSISTLFCPQCHFESNSNDSDLVLRGYFRNDAELPAQFSDLFLPDITDITCRNCQAATLLSKTRISSCGPFLILQLVRFQNTTDGIIKIQSEINGLDLDKVEIHGLTFMCTAVIAHHGDSVFGGHYTAFVRSDTSRWIHCNDSSILYTELDSSPIVTDGYIFLLKKV